VSSDTRVAVLTPLGTGAIATVEVTGPRAWEFTRSLFRPVGKSLPDSPELHRFWFGSLGAGVGDEVILAIANIEPEIRIEIHCHGGRRVVQWVVEQFTAKGCVQTASEPDHCDPWHLLTRASTLRTASILLDQAHGAFARAIHRILELLASDPSAAIEPLHALMKFVPVGRHLVEPWRVVIAGPPNVGKSSLVNALAGFQRAIVSEIAGTTRDALTVQVAFEGWPVELTDTAGLRDAEGLEAEGIERARRVLREADLVVWVMDSSQPELVFPDVETEAIIGFSTTPRILVMNKTDKTIGWPPNTPPGAIHLSAVTNEGVPELVDSIASRLVPDSPPAGCVVPFTPHLADLVVAAHHALNHYRIEEAIRFLRDCLPAD
jgi:tRNA modification GTPase